MQVVQRPHQLLGNLLNNALWQALVILQDLKQLTCRAMLSQMPGVEPSPQANKTWTTLHMNATGAAPLRTRASEAAAPGRAVSANLWGALFMLAKVWQPHHAQTP